MVEIVLILAFLAGVGWIAMRAFMTPKGVYLRSLLCFAAAGGVALTIWALADPFISDAAGLGAFLIFCAVLALSAFAALAACIAASLRYAVDAVTAGRG
jgi:hypothetical protein